MITEDYVSFEVAKLLKKKGFDEIVRCFYDIRTEILCDDCVKTTNYYTEDIAAPTFQMAMKWLREVHNFHIMVDCIGAENYMPIIQFTWNSKDIEIKSKTSKIGGNGFDSYEQACEEAIKYCLKNLIKNEDKEEESEISVPKTVDEAISTLEKILSNEDRKYLLENGAISMHDSLGRWIRNEWGLWTGSELKDELMNMNKGLNHPDDMSNYIIEEFIKYWNNKS